MSVTSVFHSNVLTIQSQTPPRKTSIPIRQVSTPLHEKFAAPKHVHLAKSLEAKEPKPQLPEAEWLQVRIEVEIFTCIRMLTIAGLDL